MLRTDLGAHDGAMVGEVGAVCFGGVGCALSVRRAAEGAELEDAAEEGPDVGKVGGNDGGGGFADVPECPVRAEGFVETVKLVEDGGEDLCGISLGFRWVAVRLGLTVKEPNAKTPTRTALRFNGSWDLRKIGIGMRMIMMSDVMLMTALVMRWFVAAEHCAATVSLAQFEHRCNILLLGGTAQYWLNGRHQTPRYKISMRTRPRVT